MAIGSQIGSSAPDEDVTFRNLSSPATDSAPVSPLIRFSDRLVADAIRRASLTHRPSIVKYPSGFFNTHEEPSSSSSSEDEKEKRKSKRNSKKIDS